MASGTVGRPNRSGSKAPQRTLGGFFLRLGRSNPDETREIDTLGVRFLVAAPLWHEQPHSCPAS